MSSIQDLFNLEDKNQDGFIDIASVRKIVPKIGKALLPT